MSRTAVGHGGKPAMSPSGLGGKPAMSPSVPGGKPAMSPSVPGGKPAISPSAHGGKPATSPSVGSKPGLAPRPLANRRYLAAAAVERDKKICIACGVISLLSTVTIIVMTILYINLEEEVSPHDDAMKKLRNSLATALGNPGLRYIGPMRVAEEVKNLPTNIKIAQSVHNEKKKMYHDLFHKAMRSSSSTWKLHGRSLYYFSNGEKTWYDAENFCVSRDAHLASVRNDEEQNFISSQLQHTSWIGLTDENKEGTWGWSDGSRLVTQYWSDGKPSNAELSVESSQDCALMVPSLTAHNWNADSCYKRYGWICKEDLDLSKP